LLGVAVVPVCLKVVGSWAQQRHHYDTLLALNQTICSAILSTIPPLISGVTVGSLAKRSDV